MSKLIDLPKEHYITVGFSRPKKPTVISRTIMAVEKTPDYSHTYIKTRANSLERTLVYHASEHNLHFMNFDDFGARNEVFEEFTFWITPEIKKKVLQFCIDKSGRKYGKLEFVGMGWVRLVRAWFGVRVKNPFRDGDFTMVCSELAGHVLKLLGEEFDTKILEVEGPRWVYNRCLDMHQRKVWKCERHVRDVAI